METITLPGHFELCRPAGSAGGSTTSDRRSLQHLRPPARPPLSADDLVRSRPPRGPGIGRATIYRTLQWMVGAGVARKVDFGDGRSRFEPAYRHPRHFHLICTVCHRSFEFLSSDVESLLEEIAGAIALRRCRPSCRFQAPATPAAPARCRCPPTAAPPSWCSRATRSRIAIATERGGLEFYRRAASLTSDRARAWGVPAARRGGRRAPEHARNRMRASHGRRSAARVPAGVSFFKGAASGLFAEGTEKLRQWHRRSAGAPHRHQMRARIAQVLQAIRRTIRRLRRASASSSSSLTKSARTWSS